jgi:alanine-synthesizing transaminase
MFSHRIPEALAPNRIAAARVATPPRFDLTESNPTACGLPYPSGLLAPLAESAGLTYRPHPLGLALAREAVAGEYLRYGVKPDPDHILLTASTSEAYAFLFKLLVDPGRTVLVPAPSYPLFEHLAQLEGIRPFPYLLDPEAAWRPDLRALAGAPQETSAVVVVNPNNPTGSYVHPDDAAALTELAAARGWAIIADEVFLDYPLDGGAGAGRSFATASDALTFSLGGLSKSVGLPQLKLAWIVTSGPEPAVEGAIERLEYIADSFLSVSTPVQLALPALLREGRAVREAILQRCRENLSLLREVVAELPAVSVPPLGGGWSAMVRVPSVVGEEELVLELLHEDRVAVHPGYFFDFQRQVTLVISLLPEPKAFAEGVHRMLQRVASHLTAA